MPISNGARMGATTVTTLIGGMIVGIQPLAVSVFGDVVAGLQPAMPG